MRAILKITKYELIKIFARKKYIAIPVLEVLFFVLLGIFVSTTNNLKLASVTINLPTLTFSALSVFLSVIFPVMVFMLVSDLITLEFENLSIKNIFLRPVSRFEVYTSKNLAIAIYMMMNLLVIYFTTILIRFVFSGMLTFAVSSFFAYIISIVPMLVFILIGTFVATYISSSSMTMFLLLIIYILLQALSVYSSPLSSIIFTNYTSYYKLFIGNAMPIKHILMVTFLLLSNCLIFFILGFLKFEKKEV